MYSACWKIKDICLLQEDYLWGTGFVTCGVRHLALWKYLGGSLVSQQADPVKATLMVVRASAGFIVAGA